jgi:hypothetical protein
VTLLFVGVGLRARGLLDEGLYGSDAAFSQTARRWNVLALQPFGIRTTPGRRTWRQLLLGIERDLVLANTHRGMVATDLADYLFARSSGHFASLMCLISRGCYRAIRTGAEVLSVELLDAVRMIRCRRMRASFGGMACAAASMIRRSWAGCGQHSGTPQPHFGSHSRCIGSRTNRDHESRAWATRTRPEAVAF